MEVIPNILVQSFLPVLKFIFVISLYLPVSVSPLLQSQNVVLSCLFWVWGIKKKSQGARSGKCRGRVSNRCHAVSSQKPHGQCCVGRCIVVVEEEVPCAPEIRPFLPDVFFVGRLIGWFFQRFRPFVKLKDAMNEVSLQLTSFHCWNAKTSRRRVFYSMYYPPISCFQHQVSLGAPASNFTAARYSRHFAISRFRWDMKKFVKLKKFSQNQCNHSDQTLHTDLRESPLQERAKEPDLTLRPPPFPPRNYRYFWVPLVYGAYTYTHEVVTSMLTSGSCIYADALKTQNSQRMAGPI